MARAKTIARRGGHNYYNPQGAPAVPVMEVYGNSVLIATGDATPSGADHTDFGSSSSGTTVSKTYTITNAGDADLTITAINLPTGYTLTDPALPFTITPGNSDTFTVRANATASGVKAGNVTVVSNTDDYVFAITVTITIASPLPATNRVAELYAGDGNTLYTQRIGVSSGVLDDNDAISSWQDESETYTLLQATGANQPVYKQSVAALNNRSAVYFDGVDNYLQAVIADAIAANLATVSIYVVMVNQTNSTVRIYDEGNSGNTNPILSVMCDGTTGVQGQFRADTGAPSLRTLTDTESRNDVASVVTFERTGGNFVLRVNGEEVDTDTAPADTATINRLTLGVRGNNLTGYFKGWLACVRVSSAADKATIEPLLGEHYGVEMPPFLGVVTYNSSIDALSLSAEVLFQPLLSNQPILVVMHGFSAGNEAFTTHTKQRFADYGVFALFVEMRGRGASAGNEDASAREIQDIVDAVEYVKTTYPTLVNANNVNIVGYSGGGGNAFAAAAKFPDYWNTVTSFFGISDYGHDAIDGWYDNGASAPQQTLMDTWIGGNPATVPDAYEARYHVNAVTNYRGGFLWMFHDEDDAIVPLVNSQNVADAMDGASLTNYDLDITTAIDNPRWEHGYPQAGDIPDLIDAESVFINPILAGTHAAWTIAASGTVIVAGYIVTKRFSIWLGGLTEAAAGAGLDEYATVVYDTNTGEYTVTPLTGSMDVFIRQGNLTASQNISGVTVLTVT